MLTCSRSDRYGELQSMVGKQTETEPAPPNVSSAIEAVVMARSVLIGGWLETCACVTAMGRSCWR